MFVPLFWCFLVLFQPKELVVPKFCVIEIGGSGPKSFLISENFKIIAKDSISASPLKNIRDGVMNDEAILKSLESTKKLITKLRTQEVDLFLVASSSISGAKNFENFQTMFQNEFGRKLHSVTSDVEAKLLFTSIFNGNPGDSALLDIGSGNTRLSYVTKHGEFKTEAINLGTLTFCDLVKTTSYGSVDILDRLLPPKPIEKPKKLYVTGGIAWAMTSFLDQMVEGSPEILNKIRNMDLKITNNHAEVTKVFSIENLHAGRALLLKMIEWTGAEPQAIRFVDKPEGWSTQWLKQHVASLPRESK